MDEQTDDVMLFTPSAILAVVADHSSPPSLISSNFRMNDSRSFLDPKISSSRECKVVLYLGEATTLFWLGILLASSVVIFRPSLHRHHYRCYDWRDDLYDFVSSYLLRCEIFPRVLHDDLHAYSIDSAHGFHSSSSHNSSCLRSSSDRFISSKKSIIVQPLHSIPHVIHVHTEVLQSHIGRFVTEDLRDCRDRNTGTEQCPTECPSECVI